MIYLIGGAEGHHEEPDQGVRHGKRGDQIIGGRVETPLLEQIIIKFRDSCIIILQCCDLSFSSLGEPGTPLNLRKDTMNPIVELPFS